jgi:predicted  nucleic acid-binding Zn-ribbon protein
MESKSKLASIIAIGKVDGSLARIAAERRKIEQTLKEKKTAIQQKNTEHQTYQKAISEKKSQYSKEEKFIRDEREKLTARRKALGSHNSYKVQQAAEREIEHASRQLDAREESALVILEECSKLEAGGKQVGDAFAALTAAFTTLESESRDTLGTLEQREAELHQQRESLAQGVDAGLMTAYNRVRDRFPMDPVVVLHSNFTCSGCFMQLGPQTALQLSKGDGIIKCRGCGRILFLSEPADELAKPS